MIVERRVQILFPLCTAIALVVCLAAAPQTPEPPATLPAAQLSFYNGNYAVAAVQAGKLRAADPADLAVLELRTSALHFELKRLLGDAPDPSKAFKACTSCPGIVSEFAADVLHGQSIARARLKTNPNDENALFYLGKIDLNYVWLQLGTLGKKTGWSEYWEARHSLDDLLKMRPNHVRGRVARAWIDYIVDTKMTWGFRWLLGGGNKKKGLAVMRETAGTATVFYERAEARFGLMEMLNREGDVKGAVVVAREIAHDFPENQEIAKFLAKKG
jgi:hypothetical protein